MKTTLKTEITVKDICEGFVYNELEGKGYSVYLENLLFSLSISVTISMLPMAAKRNGRH